MSQRLTILVSQDLCESNGVCVAKAPDVFVLQDDDVVHVKIQHPGADQLDAVRAAVRACPKAALSVIEE